MKTLIEAMKNLIEMSEKRKEIYRRLKDKLEDLAEHVGKCIVYRNTSNDLNHWKSEVYAFIHTVPKLKGTNKFPTYKNLKENVLCLIDDRMDAIASGSMNIASIEGLPDIECNMDLLGNLILEYCDWLMKTLSSSQQGNVSYYLVSGKIDELISEYNRRK